MMRKLIWRGVAVALVTGGVGFMAAQFKPCPSCPVVRLVRLVLGCKHADEPASGCSCERNPVIVDLSAPWLKDPSALFPEDNLRLEDVLPPEERSKHLDLIDLSLLSEAANPVRPDYEEEEAVIPAAEGVAHEAGNGGPEAPRVTLVESRPKPGYMPRCTDEEGPPRYMPYAEEDSEAVHVEEPPLCQEDPAAPYHYPGCPHTGPCPGTQKKDAPAMPKVDEKPTAPGSNRGADARPAVKYHMTLKKSIPADDDVRPAQPGVDTMEFRPTDAGSADFFHQRQIY